MSYVLSNNMSFSNDKIQKYRPVSSRSNLRLNVKNSFEMSTNIGSNLSMRKSRPLTANSFSKSSRSRNEMTNSFKRENISLNTF